MILEKLERIVGWTGVFAFAFMVLVLPHLWMWNWWLPAFFICLGTVMVWGFFLGKAMIP